MTARRRLKIDRVLDRRQPDLTVLAENLHKPRNFSAVIRTADAVGIHEVNVVTGGERLRRHWHTSSGTEKWVGVRRHEDIAAACEDLKARGFRLVAAHLGDDAQDYREADYTLPTALLIGTELFGVSDAALNHADACVMIPMAGMTQSLNVSVACALVLYEAQRQRAAAGLYDAGRLDADTRARLRFEWMHPKLAAFCRERGLDYPELDDEGEVIGALPRS
ncbi:MAG: tRNA (guanosine(18)-2'-O)-methyltransferase TrmH [Xanthomonadales bacterium]|nr:tRNA (guanosine(18)-2'-O)-methyltransferase TrmH [Xanthomonadales bacterium]